MLGIIEPIGGISIDIGTDAVKSASVPNDMIVKRPLPETLAKWGPAVSVDTARIITSRNRFEPLDDVRERWVFIIRWGIGRREDTEVLPYDGPLTRSISQLGCV
jgi:hypothetical protein